MRKQGLPLQRLMSAETLREISAELRYPDLGSLYAAVGEGKISAQSVVAQGVRAISDRDDAQNDLAEATSPPPKEPLAARPRSGSDSGIEVEGTANVWARLSKCCTPVPGDEITGFVTRGHGVSVHRANCANVARMPDAQRGRMVSVHWAPSDASVFLVTIQVEALDRTTLVSEVTRALSDRHVNILSASVQTTRDRVAISRFTFEAGDLRHLGDVLRAVRHIDGVYDVYRVTS
jgi:GTP pyrophosphokinase